MVHVEVVENNILCAVEYNILCWPVIKFNVNS